MEDRNQSDRIFSYIDEQKNMGKTVAEEDIEEKNHKAQELWSYRLIWLTCKISRYQKKAISSFKTSFLQLSISPPDFLLPQFLF